MLQQMLESMLRQNIKSLLAQMNLYVLTLNNFQRFVGPNIILEGPTH